MVDFEKTPEEKVDLDKAPEISAKKCTKIKVYIKSEGKTFINLPAISLSFIAMLANVGMKLALKIASMDPKNKDLDKIFEHVKDADLGLIIKELQNHEPFDIVYVKDTKSDTEVIIRTQ